MKDIERSEPKKRQSSAPKRKRFERLRDLELLRQWRLERATPPEMTKRLNGMRDYSLSRTTIEKDLKEVVAELRATEDENDKEELRRLENLERASWLQFWESVGEVITETERIEEGADTKTVTEIKKQYKSGNASFLATVLECIKERNKIFGRYAPTEYKGTIEVSEEEKDQTTFMNSLKDNDVLKIIEARNGIGFELPDEFIEN